MKGPGTTINCIGGDLLRGLADRLDSSPLPVSHGALLAQ